MVHKIIELMKRVFVGSMCLLFVVAWASAQQFYSKTGKITFVSKAPLETIEATNSSANIIVDPTTGNVEVAVLVKGFQFEKALMRDHFNENYLESHKFPKAVFKGTIANHKAVNFDKDGTYKADINGSLTLHGVTKPFIATGSVAVKSGKISVTSAFDIVIADFNIEIPKVVRENIAKTVNVRLSADLQKLATK
jgi:polyisoprenoid-binding protein YceI